MNPGALDATAVRRHLLAIEHALGHLRRLAGRSLAADIDARWAVERGLQLCAQNALEVATHLCAAAGKDAPDYASALVELGALGVLPAAFVARFRGVAGLRNVLVHGYVDLDVARLQAALAERLGDFAEFAVHVERFLEQQ
jgi:uncharacterized protein YutE (UPF0331/DUF86 family)